MIPAGSQSPHSMRVLRVLLNMNPKNDCGSDFKLDWLNWKPSSLLRTHPLTRRHAQRAVETDHLAIEIAVLNHVAHQSRVLRGMP